MRRLRVNDKDWKYDLAAAFGYILDDSNPRIGRAVRLYELQTAVSIGRKLRACQLRGKESRDNWIRAPRSALSAARSVARLRLLEHVIQERYPDVSKSFLPKKLVSDPEAKELLKQIGGSRAAKQMTYSLSWREFDRLLRHVRKNQGNYAPLYHVSLHFALHGPRGSKCNWTRAEALLKYTRKEPEYAIIRKYFAKLPSPSTVYKYKPKGHDFAPFIWLDHFGGKYLRPTRPTAATFATKLLAKVDNISELRSYLGQYEFVRTELVRQGYDLPALKLTAAESVQRVWFKPLPSELTDLI